MNIIFSVFHKAYYVPKNELIMPILVGDNKSNVILSTTKKIYRDDEGDHIAGLNANFCELTALYFIWKNFKQSSNEIIGFAHYRRYLYLPSPFLIFLKRILNKLKRKNDVDFYLENRILKDIEMKLLLSKYKILLPEKYIMKDPNGEIHTMQSYFEKFHDKNGWEMMKRIILDLYPDYSDSINICASYNSMYLCNMFITSRAILDDYCKWLFPILFSFHEQYKLTDDLYQNRMVGFVAERLLNIYIEHNFSKKEIYHLCQGFIWK